MMSNKLLGPDNCSTPNHATTSHCSNQSVWSNYMEPFFTTGQKENSVPYQSFSVRLRSPRFIATLCSVISLLHCNIFFFINGICSTSFSPCLDNLGNLVLVPLFITVCNFRSPGNRPVKNAKTNERAIIDYPRPRPTCYFHCWSPGVGTKR